MLQSVHHTASQWLAAASVRDPPLWTAVPVHWVTALVAPNGHSAHRAVVVLDEATLVSVTSATPTGPRSLAAS